ncbi:unnamed protein product [Callosobruchus maculatus]|uniref:Uncharacterized protein n=1 Tax=Callosobruchus maculatus TaxID=64391 RepID=A0A653BXZ4_CALMS|nr:unnamed protein product [Callosobruchus maculatus]
MAKRVATAWATSTFGQVEMEGRMTTATAMDTQQACGQSASTAPSMTDRMHTTTRAALPPSPLPSATALRILTLEWLLPICTANAQLPTP